MNILGNNPKIKVLDFLICSRDFSYTFVEIARNSGVRITTLKKIWKILNKYGFIRMGGKSGKKKLYTLNRRNPVVQKLIEFDRAFCLYHLTLLMKKYNAARRKGTMS